MKHNTIIALIFLLLPVMLSAQKTVADPERKVYDVGIAIVPQYAFASTMRLDIDLTLNKKSTLTLSPLFSFARNSSLLFSESSSYDYYYDETSYPQDISLTGGGLKLMLRRFFGSFDHNTGVYLGGGLHYRYSHVEYKVEDWVTYTENDMEYIIPGYQKKENNFNQFGLDFIMGYQLFIADNIYGDVYGGWGFRISDLDRDASNEYWGETVFDLAYSGYTPLLGLRMGIFF